MVFIVKFIDIFNIIGLKQGPMLFLLGCHSEE